MGAIMSNMTRRDFFKLSGLSFSALLGSTVLSGCSGSQFVNTTWQMVRFNQGWFGETFVDTLSFERDGVFHLTQKVSSEDIEPEDFDPSMATQLRQEIAGTWKEEDGHINISYSGFSSICVPTELDGRKALDVSGVLLAGTFYQA